MLPGPAGSYRGCGDPTDRDRHQALVVGATGIAGIECLTDLTASRTRGFTGYRSTLDAFALFDRLEQDRIVPAPQ